MNIKNYGEFIKENIDIKDIVVKELIDTGMWRLQPTTKPNLFIIDSNMKGFSSGRYRLEILKLKRKSSGFNYKVLVYWTPYDPYDLKFKGGFNNYKELVDIIGKVNKDLLDVSRKY